MVSVSCRAECDVSDPVVAFLAGKILEGELLVFHAQHLLYEAVDGKGSSHDLE